MNTIEILATAARDRRVLTVGACIYLLWWFGVEVLLPGSYNPLGSRLVIVVCLLGVAASTRVDRFARFSGVCFTGCMLILTCHYDWLLLNNHDQVNWVIGEYITVLAVGATFSSITALRVYMGASLLMAGLVCVLRVDLRATVFLPGLATVMLVEDVSHRARAGLVESLTRVRLLRDHAERVAAQKTNFLNLVSHELVTPLQTIHLTVGHLQSRPDTFTPADHRHLDRVARACERLLSLVRSLLDYARLEREPLRQVPESFSLADLVGKVVEQLRPQAEAKHLELRNEADGALPPLFSEPHLVTTIVTNLVGNAIKFTERGSVVVRVSRVSTGAEQLIQVTDTGPGIVAEDLGRIFESFVQLEPSQHKHTPGIGLGLAIAQNLAARLGAHLEVTSTPNQGSTFSLRLPEAPAVQPPAFNATGAGSHRGSPARPA
jgi:signal transduction histidine kinase